MIQNTLYWHDYETFGLDPARDRPVQFAGPTWCLYDSESKGAVTGTSAIGEI
jgi:exonuclease I